MKLQLHGIGYKQGGRQMVVTAMSPIALVKTVAEPDHWNPIGSQPHGNRPQDKTHRKGIAEYLESEEQFVLSAVVLYAKSSEAKFTPTTDTQDDEERVPGVLYLEYGATFDVGDGQHRIGAYSDVIKAHSEDDDPVMDRLRESGQPVVIVIDDNPLNRAQDFTDLQRNAKPPSSSIGLSMDRRQPINRLLIGLVQDPALEIFGNSADRIEFLKDSPGKLSAKLFSFKTVRYVSGTTLIGSGQRSTTSWEKAVNSLVEHQRDLAHDTLMELWKGLGRLPRFTEVISGKLTAAELREDTYLTSAGVLYAIGYAVHTAHEADKIAVSDAMDALTAVSFDRPAKTAGLTAGDTILSGNLVDPDTGKVTAGRAAWEAAGEALLAQIRKNAS